MLLTAMINRFRADGIVNHLRVATVKACIVRNLRFQSQPKEVPVALDVNRTDPPYVTGRLFALLEKIQSDSAGGELSSTIKDRYFSAASATPGTVFPRLIRLSQHHMAKLDPPRKIFYEKMLGEAVNKLDGFARHLNLEDQGLFAVGYFHQRQHLFTSKKTKEGETQCTRQSKAGTTSFTCSTSPTATQTATPTPAICRAWTQKPARGLSRTSASSAKSETMWDLSTASSRLMKSMLRKRPFSTASMIALTRRFPLTPKTASPRERTRPTKIANLPSGCAAISTTFARSGP